MSTLQQFAAAERLEELAEQIYRKLADQFTTDLDAAILFTRLGDEEHQHLLRVRMVRSRYLRDGRSIGPITLDLGEASRYVEDCEQILEGLSRRPPAGVDEARALVVALEERLATAHADMLAREAAPELRKLLQALATQDRHHAALLSKSPPAGRRSI